VLFLGLACSGLGYLFWYGALEKVEASRVAALLYVEPLVTLAAAVALLGERIQLVTVAGGVLLLVGVILVERAPASPPAAASADAA
jgi:drug/metabolite transporter (DMT)-like permease